MFPDDPPWNQPAAVIKRKLRAQSEPFLVGLEDGRIVATVHGALAAFRRAPAAARQRGTLASDAVHIPRGASRARMPAQREK